MSFMFVLQLANAFGISMSVSGASIRTLTSASCHLELNVKPPIAAKATHVALEMGC